MANRRGKGGSSDRFSFWALNSLQMVTAAMKSEDSCFLAESYGKPRQCAEKQRHYSDDNGPYSQGYGLSSSHIWLWELGHRESWALKYLCLLTVVLEKALKSSVNSKVIKSVSLKGTQTWILFGRTDAEAEAPDLWAPDVNSWLNISLMLGRTEGRRKQGHHWCNGHELGHTLGHGGRQGDLARCSPWGYKESDTTWQLNNKQRNHRT